MEHEEAQSHANHQRIPNNSSTIHSASDENMGHASSLSNDSSLSDD